MRDVESVWRSLWTSVSDFCAQDSVLVAASRTADACSETLTPRSGRSYRRNADAQARIVIQNALFAPTANTDSLIIPHCTYTDPEVAQIGKSRTLLEEISTAFDIYRVAFNDIDRGRVTGNSDGFVEVLTRAGNDVILGATIVGHDAGEQIAPLCVAMSQRLGLSGVGSAILPYPTRAEYLRRLADSYNRTRLTPLAQRIMSIWFRLSSG